MTLRERILILLSLAFCGYWGLEYIVYTQIVEPRLEKLEYSAAQEQIKKCERAIHDQASELQKFAEQLSAENDLSYLLQQSNLPESIETKADIIGFADQDGQWHAVVSNRYADRLETDDFLAQLRKGNPPFISTSPIAFSQKGIIISNAGPILIGSSPCKITSQGNLKKGTLITGRFITKEWVDRLQKRIYTNFVCIPYDQKSVSQLPEKFKENLQAGKVGYYYQKLGDSLVQFYAVLTDMAMQPAVILRINIAEDILQYSRGILYVAGFIRLAATVPAIIVLTIVFQVAVVSPILRLVKNIIAIGKGQYAGKPCSEKRRDEIGILTREFNQMLERLDAAQKKLVEKSFVSGMAEMSSGILHNARNALSPIVSGLERMNEKITAMDSPELQQAIRELEQADVDPQRKANLQRFILLSIQAQQQYIQQAKDNLSDLSRQVYQIEEMLNGQRSFRGAAKPLESVLLRQLIDEAVELVPEHLRSEVRFHVDSRIERLRPIHVQRIVFLQVLENLFVNAAESLSRAKPLYPRIKISARVEPIDNIEMLHMQIEDNGAGIEAKVMAKLFERGNSTKSRGITGIGLHWCANTIAAMKGRIWAESKGVNQGACFHIVMPVLQDKQNLMVNEKGTDHEPKCKTQNIAG